MGFNKIYNKREFLRGGCQSSSKYTVVIHRVIINYLFDSLSVTCSCTFHLIKMKLWWVFVLTPFREGFWLVRGMVKGLVAGVEGNDCNRCVAYFKWGWKEICWSDYCFERNLKLGIKSLYYFFFLLPFWEKSTFVFSMLIVEPLPL